MNKSLRDAFSIFSYHDAKKQPFVYLDNAATAQTPDVVIDRISSFYRYGKANIHRGLYLQAEQATADYEQVRNQVATYINAPSNTSVIFTKGTTESINLFAHAWAKNNLTAGDQILLTPAEHHANLLVWQQISQLTGAELVFLPFDTATCLLIEPEALISSRTKLVSLTHTSNVLGPLWQNGQLESLIAKAHQAGARVMLDCAQSIAHQAIDVQALQADAIAFSGHKFFGPTGVGVLYMHPSILEKSQPYQLGGGMIHSATLQTATWGKPPHKFEAGTPPISGVLGLGAAIDFVQKNIDWQTVAKHEATLCAMALDELAKIPDVFIAGNQALMRQHGHMVSFSVAGIHGHDIAGGLAQQGIAVRAGHHCAQPLVTMLQQESLVRVSFAAYTTHDELTLFVDELKKAISLFKNL